MQSGVGKRVLLVGHCAADEYSFRGWLVRAFGARVEAVADWHGLQAAIAEGPLALVLVNRLLDHDGSAGLEVVRQLARSPSKAGAQVQSAPDQPDTVPAPGQPPAVPPVMLVSNYPTAQAEAVAAGALPGFGKAQLGSAAVNALLEPLLG